MCTLQAITKEEHKSESAVDLPSGDENLKVICTKETVSDICNQSESDVNFTLEKEIFQQVITNEDFEADIDSVDSIENAAEITILDASLIKDQVTGK